MQQKNKRQYTEQDAYMRLSALCASAEQCTHDVRRKLRLWEVADEVSERILQRLVRERFIDDARYANAFVRDKFRYNRWGRVRIAQELRIRQISQPVIDEALQQIPEDDNLATLRRLIQAKRTTVSGRSDYEVRGKLIRFALSRGFEMDEILQVINLPDDDELLT